MEVNEERRAAALYFYAQAESYAAIAKIFDPKVKIHGVKMKRELSAYNLFMRKHLALLKAKVREEA